MNAPANFQDVCFSPNDSNRPLAAGFSWRSVLNRVAISLVVIMSTWVASQAHAADESTARELVNKAETVVKAFAQDPELASLAPALGRARAVLIFPKVLKAGLFVGGYGGNGVLLVRDEGSGAWTWPAFYTMGGASLGLLVGASSAEMVIVVNSQRTLEALYSRKLNLGGDASVALGPKGKEVGSTITSDFVVYSRIKGLYAGVAVDGSLLEARDALNTAYYGQPIKPADILTGKAPSQSSASPLQAILAATASPSK